MKCKIMSGKKETPSGKNNLTEEESHIKRRFECSRKETWTYKTN